MHKIFLSIFLMILLGFLFLSCSKEGPINLKPNLPPKTFLWIQTDSTQVLSPTISRQIIRWWGEDPDGFIIGYLFTYVKIDSQYTTISTDTVGYTWVQKNDSLVAFPLFTAKEKFQVIVKAVDNSLREKIDVGAIIRLKPKPYWDKNLNGIFDGTDVELLSIINAMDQEGAKQVFPVKNTPPTVEFTKDPLDPMKTIQQPETTFTVATFTWTGNDIDGDNTLKNYRINLNNPNDSTKWFEFSANHTMITIEAPRSRTDNANGDVNADVYIGIFPTMFKIGEVPGLKLNDTNKIYLQARDLAGELSPTVSLPTGTRKWFVKKPKSKLLTVSSYRGGDLANVVSFYKTAFSAIDSIASGRNFGNFDYIDVYRGKTNESAGELVPPILNPAFVRTLKLFEFVFWFTDEIVPTEVHVHAVAQFPLYLYSGSGGKVLYSTQFGTFLDSPKGPITDFAPIDSIGLTLLDTRIPNDWPIYPDSINFIVPFPTLRFNPLSSSGASHSILIRNIKIRADSKSIYYIPRVPNRPNWTAKDSLVAIGVIDDARTFLFLSMPLHFMNGYTKVWSDRLGVAGEGVPAFLKRVFIDEFGG